MIESSPHIPWLLAQYNLHNDPIFQPAPLSLHKVWTNSLSSTNLCVVLWDIYQWDRRTWVLMWTEALQRRLWNVSNWYWCIHYSVSHDQNHHTRAQQKVDQHRSKQWPHGRSHAQRVAVSQAKEAVDQPNKILLFVSLKDVLPLRLNQLHL